jgi:predicted 3-demethylubiquinone-9 3-methyltransferase (glyoxalase superfamily)
MVRESAAAHQFGFSEGISLTIHCRQQEIDYYWEELTESGQKVCAVG